MNITEGEWIAEKVGRNWHITLDRPDRPPIASIGGMDSPQAKANAHLMAASPKLYLACHNLLMHIAMNASDRISAKDEPVVAAQAALQEASRGWTA
jgi:hypothetical protein